MRKALLFAVVAALLLTSCADEAVMDAGGCATGGGSGHVDWADFVVHDGIIYNVVPSFQASIDEESLTEVLATTRCRIDGEVSDPHYEVRDGDAGFLDPGTELWAISGYDQAFRIAAFVEGEPVVYESETVEGAETGADLLDIEGKVSYIGINSPKDETTEIAAIRDPEQVRRLVELVLSAPVEQEQRPGDQDTQRFIAFHLRDGTSVVRAFFPESRLLWRGITVPDEFVDAIEQAVLEKG